MASCISRIVREGTRAVSMLNAKKAAIARKARFRKAAGLSDGKAFPDLPGDAAELAREVQQNAFRHARRGAACGDGSA